MKRRVSFVANSSSSSFLIIGDTFETVEAAEVMQRILENDPHGYVYTHGDKLCDGTEVAGIDLGGYDEDTTCEDAQSVITKMQAAIDKCIAAGIANPLLIAGCSSDH